MIRIAGRTNNGTAKALNLDNAGYLRTTSINERQYLGDFVEPYDEGYVGNIALSGLEVFGKAEFVISDIVDIKTGKKGIYVLQNDGTLTKFDLHFNEKVWGYKNTDPNIYHLRVDNNDDAIISSGSTTDWRIIEKIDGETGARIWRDVYNNANYVRPIDIFVDLKGDVYTIGYNGSGPAEQKILLRKHSSLDGSLLWSMSYQDLGSGSDPYLFVKSNDIYIASRHSIRKLNQSNADSLNPPTTLWMHAFEVFNRSFLTMLVIDNKDKAFIYQADNTSRFLVKLDLANANETKPPVIINKLTLDTNEHSVSNLTLTRPKLDVTGNVYIEDGKFDENLVPIWGGKSPVTIYDLRDGYLYGCLKSPGRYGEPVFEVYKLGLDLQVKGYRGIK